jgi:L-lactate dehydrogenase complex protein LldG
MGEPDRASSKARARILSRLRAHAPALAESSQQAPGATPALLGAKPALPVRRFAWSLSERRDRFAQQLRHAQAEVIAVVDDWPRTLAHRLAELGASNLRYGSGGPLASELCIGWPAWGIELIRHQTPIEHCRDALFEATDAAITSCVGGIAETGSLVLWPTPAEPRLLSLVPPIHVVLLEAGRLFSTLHELMRAERWGDALVEQASEPRGAPGAELRGAPGAEPGDEPCCERDRPALPTNIVLISGPSKSADIEQTLAYGVHGPKRLIVLVRG